MAVVIDRTKTSHGGVATGSYQPLRDASVSAYQTLSRYQLARTQTTFRAMPIRVIDRPAYFSIEDGPVRVRRMRRVTEDTMDW